jgi:hypothetical protein
VIRVANSCSRGQHPDKLSFRHLPNVNRADSELAPLSVLTRLGVSISLNASSLQMEVLDRQDNPCILNAPALIAGAIVMTPIPVIAIVVVFIAEPEMERFRDIGFERNG